MFDSIKEVKIKVRINKKLICKLEHITVHPQHRNFACQMSWTEMTAAK